MCSPIFLLWQTADPHTKYQVTGNTSASAKLPINNTNCEHRNCDGRNNSREYVIVLEHINYSLSVLVL